MRVENEKREVISFLGGDIVPGDLVLSVRLALVFGDGDRGAGYSWAERSGI